MGPSDTSRQHHRPTLILIAIIMSALAACSGSNQCTPGASIACACPDGRAGAQSCNTDGTFAPCVCASAAAAPPPSPAPPPVVPAAQPPPAGLVWAPLERTWTRLHLDTGCDADAYGSMTTQPTWEWATPGGTVTLQVRVQERDATEEDGPLMSERTIELIAEWPGSGEPRVLGTWGPLLDGTCAERQAQVVYAGRRVDGLMLVSMENLPQRSQTFMPLPGRSRRYIYDWNAQTNAPRQLATWEGLTLDAPNVFRLRAAGSAPRTEATAVLSQRAEPRAAASAPAPSSSAGTPASREACYRACRDEALPLGSSRANACALYMPGPNSQTEVTYAALGCAEVDRRCSSQCQCRLINPDRCE